MGSFVIFEDFLWDFLDFVESLWVSNFFEISRAWEDFLRFFDERERDFFSHLPLFSRQSCSPGMIRGGTKKPLNGLLDGQRYPMELIELTTKEYG